MATSNNQRIAVGYIRVSTRQQGESHLGLDAQKATIENACKFYGYRLVKIYEEVESGKKDNRPQLAAAMKYCRLSKAVLIVAKIDRLSRSASFLYDLMETGIDFHFCDLPTANKQMLGFMFSLAQAEREMISARTKAALEQKKAQGVKLGCPLGAAAFGDRRGAGAAEGRIRKADDFASDAIEFIRPLHEQGYSLRKIAAELNGQGLRTRRGCEWTACSVQAVLKRAA